MALDILASSCSLLTTIFDLENQAKNGSQLASCLIISDMPPKRPSAVRETKIKMLLNSMANESFDIPIKSRKAPDGSLIFE